MGAVPSPFQDYSYWIFVYLSGFLGLVFCFQSRPAVPVQVCGLLFSDRCLRTFSYKT